MVIFRFHVSLEGSFICKEVSLNDDDLFLFMMKCDMFFGMSFWYLSMVQKSGGCKNCSAVVYPIFYQRLSVLTG